MTSTQHTNKEYIIKDHYRYIEYAENSLQSCSNRHVETSQTSVIIIHNLSLYCMPCY